MESKAQHGYLVLADMSGYSSYVAKTELEHSQEILGELLELLVKQMTSALTLHKLEGDAVFAYAPESKVTRGEMVLELIEATYVAFRDRVEGIRRRTTCECNACRAIPMLDLKFISHHGDYIIQHVAGINEMVGNDVNLAHRLLKNHVGEATGWRGYALFTEESLEHMGLRPEGMHEQDETYDLGEVKTRSLNLQKRYKELTDTRRVFITAEEADTTFTVEIPAPPPIVWNWLNDPGKRLLWEGLHIRPVALAGGRTDTGAKNHCVHGKQVSSIETILDWRPFDYFTIKKTLNQGPSSFTLTCRLEPTAGGRETRLHGHITLQMPLPGPLIRPACNMMMNLFGIIKRYEALPRLIAQEMSREQTEPSAMALSTSAA